MAIQPDISLSAGQGIQAPNWTSTLGNVVGAAQGMQQIQNLQAQLPLIQAQTGLTQAQIPQTQAQTANLQAQNPGLVAQSQSAQAAAVQNVRSSNAQIQFGKDLPMFTTPGPNGIMQTDWPAMMKYEAAQGYADFLPAISKAFADTSNAQIKTAQDQLTLGQARETASAQTPGMVAQLLNSLPPAQQPLKYYQMREQALQQLGPDVVNENSWPTEPKEGISAWVNSNRAVTMTPQQQTLLDQAQQNINISNGQLGVQQKLLGNDIGRWSTYIAGEQSAAGLDSQASQAINAFKSTAPLTGIGSWADKQFQTYVTQNPQMSIVMQRIAAYNAAHPGEPLTPQMGWVPIQKILDNSGTVHAMNVNGGTKAIGVLQGPTPGAQGVPGGGPQLGGPSPQPMPTQPQAIPPINPVPTAPTAPGVVRGANPQMATGVGGTVRMTKPGSNKVYNIPADQVQGAQRFGYTPLVR